MWEEVHLSEDMTCRWIESRRRSSMKGKEERYDVQCKGYITGNVSP